ncbi:hypothetical protein MKX03_037124 [Papaver bracteatum]|nr:hypothetical protein MKX03_037124 [Papaver bracteatum]
MGMTQELSTQFKSCRLLLGNAKFCSKPEQSYSVIEEYVLIMQIGRSSGSYHFCRSIRQARQLISHRRVCVNNAVRSINHFKVSPGDCRNSEISFLLVLKIVGQVQNQPSRLWRRTKVDLLRLLKTKVGSRILMKSDFLRDLHSTIAANVHLGSHFAEHNKMKSHYYNFTWRFLNLAQYMIPK